MSSATRTPTNAQQKLRRDNKYSRRSRPMRSLSAAPECQRTIGCGFRICNYDECCFRTQRTTASGRLATVAERPEPVGRGRPPVRVRAVILRAPPLGGLAIHDQPTLDLLVDFDAAEEVEMSHSESDPLLLFGQPEVDVTGPIPSQGTAHRDELVAAHFCASRTWPRLPARRDRVAANPDRQRPRNSPGALA